MQAYTPELELSDEPDAWHPDDALMVPLRVRRRRAAGHRLGRRAGDRPPPVARSSSSCSARSSRTPPSRSSRRRPPSRAPPPRRRRAPAARLGPADRARARTEEVLDAVCGGIREALGFQQGASPSSPRTGRLVPLSGVGFTAERAAEFPLVDGRGARAAARPRVPAPRLRRDGARRGGRASRPSFRGVYSSVSQRARAAAPGTTTGSWCRCTTATAGSTG